jgi:hypothetical protein
VVIILDRSAIEMQTWIRIMPIMKTRIHATHMPVAEPSTASEADLKDRIRPASHYWSWLQTFRHRSSLALSGSGPTTTPLLVKLISLSTAGS